MPRRTWTGDKVTRAKRFVIRRDRGICWLCGHPGANSLDHIIPASDRPDLEWNPSNWKAAHLHNAGRLLGCQEPGCQCIGNVRRGTTPHTAPPSRDW